MLPTRDTCGPGNDTAWRSRSGLLNRTRCGYLEMPRLFYIDRNLRCGLMVALVDAGVLVQTSDGRYVRRGGGLLRDAPSRAPVRRPGDQLRRSR